MAKTLALLFLLSSVLSCTSDQQEEGDLEATEAGSEKDPDDAPDAEGSEVDPAAAKDAEAAPAEEVDGSAESAEPTGPADPTAAPDSSGQASEQTMEAPATAEAPPGSAPGSAAAGGGAPTSNRVLRYVKKGGAPIYAEPSKTGARVGELEQGDRVLIIPEGAWGRINDNNFVEMKTLTEKGTGREKRKSQWQKP
jgi:cytoskeletal protein RodZ